MLKDGKNKDEFLDKIQEQSQTKQWERNERNNAI